MSRQLTDIDMIIPFVPSFLVAVKGAAQKLSTHVFRRSSGLETDTHGVNITELRVRVLDGRH
jgi:hypothetical protein